MIVDTVCTCLGQRHEAADQATLTAWEGQLVATVQSAASLMVQAHSHWCGMLGTPDNVHEQPCQHGCKPRQISGHALWKQVSVHEHHLTQDMVKLTFANHTLSDTFASPFAAS